ncbi:MAG: hypothetical protein EBQ97_06465, partial [Bacteroidetes bacterium]|nr:hypothetical protein [Bacteroidota bacterium]
MPKIDIVGILTYMPFILLLTVIMMLSPKEVPVYSHGILRFCLQEELAFRIIPFQYIYLQTVVLLVPIYNQNILMEPAA